MFILFNPNPRGNFVGDMLDTTQDQRIRDALTQAINMLK